MKVIPEEVRKKMAEARRQWWRERTPEQKEQFRLKQVGKKHPSASLKLKGRKGTKRRTGKFLACELCGKSIYRNRAWLEKFKHFFCSTKCTRDWYINDFQQNKKLYKCQSCGKEFHRVPSREKYNHGNHYCSVPCANKSRSGEGHPAWDGGRQKRRDGYIDLSQSLVPESYRIMIRKERRVMEHRLVMAQYLGRPLESFEVVHHKNGIRDDNRIENLELHPNAFTHNGVTASENKEVVRLKRKIAELSEQLAELERARGPKL